MNLDLEARLRRLMLFRVVMVTTLLFIATYVEAVSETLSRVNPLYFVIVATYALTVVYALALRFLPAADAAGLRPGRRATCSIITALVYVSGGRAYRLPAALPAVGALRDRARAAARCRSASRGAGDRALRRGCCSPSRSGVVSPPGLADVVTLPTRALLYSIFVLGVACVDGGPARLVPRREPAARGPAARGGRGRGGRPARAQPGDRRQHPERPHHDRRGGPRAPR